MKIPPISVPKNFSQSSPANAVTVALISLGCAKNLVDSEIMAGHLGKAGMRLIPHQQAADADVVIINTCSFIDASKQESINLILETDQNRVLRKRRNEQKLIVAGCLVQRFAKQLPCELPEVDAFIGLDQISQVADIIKNLSPSPRAADKPPPAFTTAKSTYIPDYTTPRYQLTPAHFAYVKIAEGCNHPCSFCIIPQIRGRHRSRPIDDIVKQVRQLVAGGTREINLIAQDTTYYGMDKWSQHPGPRAPVDSSRGPALSTLLRELNAIEGDFWIRLLYTHPAHWSDELISTINDCGKVARYVDIPLQHISDHMLKLMNRETDGAYVRDLIRRIRAGIPGITIRTTFIVGFPGETRADSKELLDFIGETRFERLGVFQYSREDNTRAARLPQQIGSRTKSARHHRAMQLQQQIAAERGRQLVGKKIKVLVEERGIARSQADAPDIDGRIYVSKKHPVGSFAEVVITASDAYDLYALPKGESPVAAKARKQAQ